MTEPSAMIVASPRAREALRRLSAENAGVIVHITGGAEQAGSPVVLPAGELFLGPRDHFVGVVEGIGDDRGVDDVLVYRMPSRASGLDGAPHYLLDVSPGMPVGFSLSPGDGLAFVLRERWATAP